MLNHKQNSLCDSTVVKIHNAYFLFKPRLKKDKALQQNKIQQTT